MLKYIIDNLLYPFRLFFYKRVFLVGMIRHTVSLFNTSDRTSNSPDSYHLVITNREKGKAINIELKVLAKGCKPEDMPKVSSISGSLYDCLGHESDDSWTILLNEESFNIFNSGKVRLLATYIDGWGKHEQELPIVINYVPRKF